MRFAAAALLFIALVGFFGDSAQAQCAMCRTALENSPEGRALAGSFNNGILFLLAAPYAIFGTVGFVLIRAYRKKARAPRPKLYIP